MNNSELIRYSAHINLEEIGVQGQQKLAKARVLIVGAGGLGSPVIQYLGAAGIGCIGVVDNDQIQISNLPRQVLFRPEHIGLNKAEVICNELKHSDSKLIPYPIKFEKPTALNLLADYNLIVDCTDHNPTRYLINDAAVVFNKPMVYAGIYKFQAQVSVFNYENGPTYRCLFPEKDNIEQCRPCSETGVLSATVGLAGLYQTNETLKILLGVGDILSGKLLVFDSRTVNHKLISFNRNPNYKEIAERSFENVLS